MYLDVKIEILVSGLANNIDGFIDGYELRKNEYDGVINRVGEEGCNYFDINISMVKSLLPYENKNKLIYLTLVRNISIEYKDNLNKQEKDDIYSSKCNEILSDVLLLEKKIRLITGQAISFPVIFAHFKFTDGESFPFVNYSGKVPRISLFDYDIKFEKTQLDRLQLDLGSLNLEINNDNNNFWIRAIDLYFDSFDSNSIGSRFILLFSCLESIFLEEKVEKIASSIAKYSSKIHFLSAKEKGEIRNKLIELYNIRSEFIHGSAALNMNEGNEQYLREFVRETLLLYLYFFRTRNMKNITEMTKFLDETCKRDLSVEDKEYICNLYTKNSNEI